MQREVRVHCSPSLAVLGADDVSPFPGSLSLLNMRTSKDERRVDLVSLGHGKSGLRHKVGAILAEIGPITTKRPNFWVRHLSDSKALFPSGRSGEKKRPLQSLSCKRNWRFAE